MGLFNFGKPKPKSLVTTLVSSKSEQAALSLLAQGKKPLKVIPDLSANGNLLLRVGTSSSRIIGKLPAKITSQIEQNYAKKGSLSCALEIGTNYSIENDGANYSCTTTLLIIPK